MTDPEATLKQQAGTHAADLVESGMVVGLGTGSTAIFAIRAIAARVQSGALRDVTAIATSRASEAAARALGIALMEDDLPREIDLTIDGADEVDPALDLIKGGGGALLREKIVAQASRRVVIVVDEGKLSPALGTRWALPVEVLAFGWRSQLRFLEGLGAKVTARDGGRFRTDSGNLILDAAFGPMAEPGALAVALNGRAGIVEQGLFLGIATDVIVAGEEGVKRFFFEKKNQKTFIRLT
jgi:ribose 5-phosphate isomerase A